MSHSSLLCASHYMNVDDYLKYSLESDDPIRGEVLCNMFRAITTTLKWAVRTRDDAAVFQNMLIQKRFLPNVGSGLIVGELLLTVRTYWDRLFSGLSRFYLDSLESYCLDMINSLDVPNDNNSNDRRNYHVYIKNESCALCKYPIRVCADRNVSRHCMHCFYKENYQYYYDGTQVVIGHRIGPRILAEQKTIKNV